MTRRDFLTSSIRGLFLGAAISSGLGRIAIAAPLPPINFSDKLKILIHDNAKHIPVIIFRHSTDEEWSYVRQGVPVEVDRRYVEMLLQGKEARHYPDGSSETLMKYPFTVLHDPHPDGYTWAKSVLNG